MKYNSDSKGLVTKTGREKFIVYASKSISYVQRAHCDHDECDCSPK